MINPNTVVKACRQLEAAGTGLTVLIASHVVFELERLCDWLIVLVGGHVQLAGPADDLIAAHRRISAGQVVHSRAAARWPDIRLSCWAAIPRPLADPYKQPAGQTVWDCKNIHRTAC